MVEIVEAGDQVVLEEFQLGKELVSLGWCFHVGAPLGIESVGPRAGEGCRWVGTGGGGSVALFPGHRCAMARAPGLDRARGFH